MKKAFLTSASICALIIGTGAQAADLNRPIYKAPIAPAPAWSWAGFYLGGTVGGVFSHNTVANDPASGTAWLVAPGSTNGSGVIGGLEAGYNWQFSQLVLGLEGDVSWSSLNRSVGVSVLGAGIDTFSSHLNPLGTIRGRVGWAFDRTLVYGTGGVAFASLKDTLVDRGFTAATGSSETGWTAGAGIEYALTDHWTAKAEYLHVGFAQRTSSTPVVGAGTYVFDFRDRLDVGRVGINYKF